MDNLINIKDEFDIKCGDCGALLANCVSTQSDEFSNKENQLKCQFIIKCYKCEGKSYPSKVVTGRSHLNPPNDALHFRSTDTYIMDDIVINQLEVRK